MISIRNFYYMLSYVVPPFDGIRFRRLGTEDFESAQDFLAQMLCVALTSLVKRGMAHEYVEVEEELQLPRGKFLFPESLKRLSLQRQRLVCTFDDFSIDSRANQIIKATMLLLIRSDVSKERKRCLTRLLPYFSDVSVVGVDRLDWNVPENRNNMSIQHVLFICRLVLDGLLQNEEAGVGRKNIDLDWLMRRYHIYEKFILAYYRREFPTLKASAKRIDWQLDPGSETRLLPVMQSDITLEDGRNTLVIDAKFYDSILIDNHSLQEVRSGHLYQIFSYVKNLEASQCGMTVAGALLYARTDYYREDDMYYLMSGNRIGVCTLDLNQSFDQIAGSLNSLVRSVFGPGCQCIESWKRKAFR